MRIWRDRFRKFFCHQVSTSNHKSRTSFLFPITYLEADDLTPSFEFLAHKWYLAKIGLKASHFKSTNRKSFSGISSLNTELLSVFYEGQSCRSSLISAGPSVKLRQSFHSSPVDFSFHPQRQLLQTSGSLLNFPNQHTTFSFCGGPQLLPYLEGRDHTTWIY